MLINFWDGSISLSQQFMAVMFYLVGNVCVEVLTVCRGVNCV